MYLLKNYSFIIFEISKNYTINTKYLKIKNKICFVDLLRINFNKLFNINLFFSFCF